MGSTPQNPPTKIERKKVGTVDGIAGLPAAEQSHEHSAYAAKSWKHAGLLATVPSRKESDPRPTLPLVNKICEPTRGGCGPRRTIPSRTHTRAAPGTNLTRRAARPEQHIHRIICTNASCREASCGIPAQTLHKRVRWGRGTAARRGHRIAPASTTDRRRAQQLLRVRGVARSRQDEGSLGLS